MDRSTAFFLEATPRVDGRPQDRYGIVGKATCGPGGPQLRAGSDHRGVNGLLCDCCDYNDLDRWVRLTLKRLDVPLTATTLWPPWPANPGSGSPSSAWLPKY
jgi:hypothetical protein